MDQPRNTIEFRQSRNSQATGAANDPRPGLQFGLGPNCQALGQRPGASVGEPSVDCPDPGWRIRPWPNDGRRSSGDDSEQRDLNGRLPARRISASARAGPIDLRFLENHHDR
jgi:hypothetical protein